MQVELNSWMRVIRNLTTLSNVFIDDFNDFESSLFAFKNWAIDIYKDKSFNSITSYINSNPKKRPKGRNVSLQLREEEHKARLFLKDQTWKDLIREIEEHKYFLGQINFLLQWSNDSLDEFKKYNHAVKKIFDENGLKSYLSKDGEHLFRNCLLVNDNYLNQSCFINNINKNRDRSWKNYLRYKEKHYNIKKIIDGWSKSKIKSFNDFCINEIKTKKNNVVDWRRCFLEFPEIYDICSKDKIYYFNNDTTKIFLLETSLKWNGLNRHTELFTYYWSLLLNNFGGWSSVYFNSQEDCPLCVKFSKENYDIICQFVLSDNSSKYSLRINFNPEESVYKKEDESWYRYFNTEESKEVEKELRKLMA